MAMNAPLQAEIDSKKVKKIKLYFWKQIKKTWKKLS